MKYVEALTDYMCAGTDMTLFLAGGITNCPDWQMEMVGRLADTDLTILNPRRANFPMDDPNASEEQIKWEHKHMNRVDAILFWFPPETNCPITLYELGMWNPRPKKIFVGCDPCYSRIVDVRVQTTLERPSLKVAVSLEELEYAVKRWTEVKKIDKFSRDHDQPEGKKT
jgi:hypothetical protein